MASKKNKDSGAAVGKLKHTFLYGVQKNRSAAFKII